MLPTGALRRTVASCSIVHMSSQSQLRKASTPEGEAVIEQFQLTEADVADIPVLAEEYFAVENRNIRTVERDIFNRIVGGTNRGTFLYYDELKGKLSKEDIRAIKELSTSTGISPSVSKLQETWAESVQKLPAMIVFLQKCEAMATDEINATVHALVSISRYHNALEQLTLGIPDIYPVMQDFVREAFPVTNTSWPARSKVRSDLVELDEQLRVAAKARDQYFIYRTSDRLERFLEEALTWRDIALKANLSTSGRMFVKYSEIPLARIDAALLMESSWS